MNILTIDTTVNGSFVSVMHANGVFSKTNSHMRGQASFLLSLISNTLQEASIKFTDIDLLAVATGPGSFTGIRVGIAAMQGISLSADIPLIGINNFDIYSHYCNCKYDNCYDIFTIIESYRSEVFCRIKRCNGDTGTPFQADIDEIIRYLKTEQQRSAKKAIICGGASKILEQVANSNIPNMVFDVTEELVTSEVMIDVVLNKVSSGEELSKMAEKNLAVPFYIRPPDVTFSKK